MLEDISNCEEMSKINWKMSERIWQMRENFVQKKLAAMRKC
jgi:hypothetical protein